MFIGDKYKIESDPINVILYRKRAVKKGDATRWQAIGYFSTIKNALEYWANLEVNETAIKDLETVTKKQDEITKLIKGLGETLEPPPKRARACLGQPKTKSRQLILGKGFAP